MKIAQIDKNFLVENQLKENVKFYDVREAPFKVYGLYDVKSGAEFKRMDSEVAKSISKGGEEFTVDGGHPTDLGFFKMAEVIGQKIKEVIR